ncbi:endosome/lysosome-associated apoptosis and autophagy regulator family member 2-like isoform X1 [Biomphalaria glabrata]|uniref:Endosome/lysosome-associated apoptosis and autophagy regulator family member 2-like isoform X1 n=1 Tax=Biomphalaria glabrata TaxID=6526 RepID=A0A9W3A6L4_BIOGL|nr:endosome/lysosome-associated apoptosis and autophagy regulator family member 2-like isoform X1 [Biomphalaria glabrata]XP_055882864.1 endosome/lysosome-associated apoptosis and autophagy regulator family member 2-like isoform X1 [Biomphalaria glabrata]XP_055882865.1 endosome/lysosome-associated apoptosis and autophagy regulator family member 2-like isoform X1 [Biomphalaria glabrata]
MLLCEYSYLLLWLASSLLFISSSADLPQCRLDEFHYVYTECDSQGGRWRVPVPKNPGACTPANYPGLTTRGKECDFACNAGEYLDIQGDQQCHPCPAGTYSLGGGIRYNEWDILPTGFAVKVEQLAQDGLSGWRRKQRSNCSRSEWTPRGNYIMSIPSHCPSDLLFSAKLVRPGKVTFEYQYTDTDSLFHFTVQNDQCQASDSEDNDKWPEITSEGKWSTIVVNLKTGMNVLRWRTIGALSEMMHSTVSPILIGKIEITGVAYTSECSKCPNGTYSSGGTSFCQLCPADQFSGHGAKQCTPCPSSEYAEIGSPSCMIRPPCTNFDYYSFQKPCDADGQTQVIFSWMEPKICNDKDPQSVLLPKNGDLEQCPPCNKGMYRVNNSECAFCQPNHYVDDNSMCLECRENTSPNYYIDYQHWSVLPQNMSAHCVPVGVTPCSNMAGWIPSGDHVRTIFGLNDNNTFLVLLLKLPGFRGEPGTVDGKPIPLSTVTFDMELNCPMPCQLVFLSDADGKNAVLKSWDTTAKRTTYTQDIFTNESMTLTWAFQPDDFGYATPDDDKDHHKMENYVKIYSIQVSNTVDGGATSCETCPEGKSGGECIPCPDGQYIDSHTQTCQPCPPGTVLPSSNSWGQSSCKPCGQGLHPVGGRSCKSDCHFTDDSGREYDFTELDTIHFVSGSRLFTASGTQYYHGFNLTLCNHGNKPLPSCVNNVTSENVKQGSKELELLSRENFLNQPGPLSSMVCRTTLIPQSDQEKVLVSTQPVSLGTHLTKILTNISLEALYTEEGFPTEGLDRDIHFYYESGSSTSACPNGRTSIISLRCEPTKTGNGEILLSPKCSDGTCDGCTFHFLWLTRHACATCRKEDYHVVRGECVQGEQVIHYFPPDHCLQLPEGTLTPNKMKCQILPFALMVAIPVTVGLGLILLILLIYCWSRNKKLEYKYMKLVETAGGHDGEMPAADTCGMEDDEEDVHFAEQTSSFFGKLKEKFSRAPNKDEDNPFVAVKMSEKMSLT